MVNVQVLSRKQFEDYAAKMHNHNTLVISISSFNEPIISDELLKHPCNKSLIVYRAVFDDTDKPENGMSSIQAMEIAEFIKHNMRNCNKIIVHCGAGQSRSAGVAAAILKYFNGDDTQIFDNRRYTPNMRCYRLTLEALLNS